MLTVEIPGTEYFDDEKQEFHKVRSVTLQLEHSLVSLSKWEEKWKKPFLTAQKTPEESLDYVRCMTINHGVPDEVYMAIPPDIFQEIMDYIADPMTATTFPPNHDKPNREIITAELIYFWMISQSIPFECRKWHLNRLLTLIRVCITKNSPPKKMNKNAIMAQNRSLNAARRARLNSKG